jgi:hypothetical protein
MRPFPDPSAHDGSSAIETMLVVALACLVTAAIVGTALVMSLRPRSTSSQGQGPLSNGPPVASVPVLEIACGADDASVGGRAVDATNEGVPVMVAGDDGAVLSFASRGVPVYRMHVVEPSGSYALPLSPGEWTVGCAASGTLAETATLGTFEVRDPGSVYLRTQPECPASGCCNDIVDLPPGFADDDLGALRQGLADVGVLPTDTIERAAYPASTFSAQPPNPLVYRVVRDLTIVARVDVAGKGDAWSANVYGCPAG